MELSPAYHTSNPITRAELNYQARSVPQGRRWQRFVGRLTLTLAFVLAGILAGGEIVGALLFRDPEPINQFVGVGALLPFGVVLALHFGVMLRTLILSSNSIAREKQANNWDILVLTGINARQIIRGKWWATMRRMWRAYLLLAALRVVMIIWYATYVSRNNFYSLMYYYLHYGYTPASPVAVPTFAHFLAATVMVFIFTMINLPFTAACGLSAISARARNSALVLARAISTRLLLVLGLSVGTLAIMSFMWSNLATRGGVHPWSIDTTLFIQTVTVTLLDNGLTNASQLTQYRTNPSSFDRRTEFVLPNMLVSIAIYVLLTWLLLRLAEWLAVRQNALR
jgi:hypothetical protein